MNKPKEDRSLVKTMHIMVKLNPDEHKRISDYAEKMGVSKSMLMRMAALEFIRKREN
jgi:predicted transcriptional regulator